MCAGANHCAQAACFLTVPKAPSLWNTAGTSSPLDIFDVSLSASNAMSSNTDSQEKMTVLSMGHESAVGDKHWPYTHSQFGACNSLRKYYWCGSQAGSQHIVVHTEVAAGRDSKEYSPMSMTGILYNMGSSGYLIQLHEASAASPHPPCTPQSCTELGAAGTLYQKCVHLSAAKQLHTPVVDTVYIC